MAFVTRVSLVLIVFVVATTIAAAQAVQDSSVSGTLTSASVQIPANGSATVFVVPFSPPNSFVLTQVCKTRNTKIILIGNTVGQIPLSKHHRCTSFTPGFAIPAGETLTCATTVGSSQDCMVTGELLP